MDCILKIDPEFEDVIPPISSEEFEQLEKNIVSEGALLSPIIIWNGYIVDGHNRYIKRIAEKLNDELNDKVCQGTGMRPNDRIEAERKQLIKTDLSCLNAYFEKPVKRKVSRESMVTYQGCKYSVPTQYGIMPLVKKQMKFMY